MKKFLLLFLILSFFISCEKKKEDVQQDLVIMAMTNGQWKVTSYMKGSTSHTTDFDIYRFQFKENNTVDAINSGSVEKTGTWNGDAVARTIASQFNNAGATLTLLNGTWQISRNSWTYVEAKQTVNGTEHTLRLDKQ